MNERLYSGVSHAAWGCVFLSLDINLGQVSILPRFVGWLLFLSAISELKEDRRDLVLLRPLAVFLALWTGADWLASWVGGDIDGFFLPMDIVSAAAQMYFQFQFFADMAALAEMYHAKAGLGLQIRNCRAAQIVFVTAFGLAPYLSPWLPEDAVNGAIVVLMILYCILGLYLTMALFTLRNCFRDGMPDDSPA